MQRKILTYLVSVLALLLFPSCGEDKPGSVYPESRGEAGTPTTLEKTTAPEKASVPEKATVPEKKDLLRPAPKAIGAGLKAIKDAAAAKKYLFVFFHKDKNGLTDTLKELFDGTMSSVRDRAEAIAIDVRDAAEADIVAKFHVSRAPMPLVLVLAPNGAVVKGLPETFTKAQLLAAFASPCQEKILKALQEGQNVALCVQNAKTSSNKEAMAGVKAFAASKDYSGKVEIITLDPAASAEAKTLEMLEIDPAGTEAKTILLAPPGKIVAKYSGATDLKTLTKALSACCDSPGGT